MSSLMDPTNQLLNKDAFYFRKGERIAKSVALTYLGSWIPQCLQRLIGSMMNCKLFPFLYSKRTSVLFGAGACSSTDLWDATGDKCNIIEEVLEEWKRLNLNAVICPLFPFPAPPVNLPGLLPSKLVNDVKNTSAEWKKEVGLLPT